MRTKPWTLALFVTYFLILGFVSCSSTRSRSAIPVGILVTDPFRNRTFNCVRLADFFFSSILFDRFQSFDEIRLSITECSIIDVGTPQSLFIHPDDQESNLPDQARLVPREMTFLLTLYNQCCCSGLHVLLNYICTRRSLYFLDHTHKKHASSSTFSSSYPRMHLRSVWTKAGRVG